MAEYKGAVGRQFQSPARLYCIMIAGCNGFPPEDLFIFSNGFQDIFFSLHNVQGQTVIRLGSGLTFGFGLFRKNKWTFTSHYIAGQKVFSHLSRSWQFNILIRRLTSQQVPEIYFGIGGLKAMKFMAKKVKKSINDHAKIYKTAQQTGTIYINISQSREHLFNIYIYYLFQIIQEF